METDDLLSRATNNKNSQLSAALGANSWKLLNRLFALTNRTNHTQILVCTTITLLAQLFKNTAIYRVSENINITIIIERTKPNNQQTNKWIMIHSRETINGTWYLYRIMDQFLIGLGYLYRILIQGLASPIVKRCSLDYYNKQTAKQNKIKIEHQHTCASKWDRI